MIQTGTTSGQVRVMREVVGTSLMRFDSGTPYGDEFAISLLCSERFLCENPSFPPSPKQKCI